MSFALTEDEYRMLSSLPEDDIVDLAVEFDIVVDAELNLQELFKEIIQHLADLAASEGLPLHKYNRDDLEALPAPHLQALAALMGEPANINALLKRGAKVYKLYNRERPKSHIALTLPMLLEPLARFAAERQDTD